jgi:hypothetical protein
LYGLENGEAKGLAAVVVDVVGVENEAGRAGTEGGVVVDTALADGAVEVGTADVGAGLEVTVAGAGDVDAAAVAAMVPLRSHGFGGEAIAQIGGLTVHRNASV